jgi:hypothetical protein
MRKYKYITNIIDESEAKTVKKIKFDDPKTLK